MGGDHGEAPCKLKDGKVQTPTMCTPTVSAEPSTAAEKVGQQPDLPARNTPAEAAPSPRANDHRCDNVANAQPRDARPLTRRLRMGDWFCGGGGASLGAAGYDIVFGIDTDQAKLDVFARNHPEATLFCEDIGNPEKWIQRLEHPHLRCDVWHMSCPCQGFSFASTNRGNDPRTWLTVQAADIVISSPVAPDALVFENVANVQHSEEWRIARAKLQEAGYNITEQIVNLSRLRVPQHRRRLMVIATRNGVTDDLTQRLAAISDTPPYTMGDAFPERRAYFHSSRRSFMPCILPASTPHPTLRTACAYHPRPGSYSPRVGDAAPIEQVRRLTVPDYMKIQGWPDDAFLPDNRRFAVNILANSVAPPMQEFVMAAIRWPPDYERRRSTRWATEAPWRASKTGAIVTAAVWWWRRRHEADLLRERWQRWEQRLYKLTFNRPYRPLAPMSTAWTAEATARMALDNALMGYSATATDARSLRLLPAVATEEAAALWHQVGCIGTLDTAPDRADVVARAGIRIDAQVDVTATTPAWALALSGTVPLPSAPPVVAAAAAARIAVAACAAAGTAWALALPIIAAPLTTPACLLPPNGSAGRPHVLHVPAAIAASVAAQAARDAEDLALHAFFESTAFDDYAAAHGDGADPIEALAILQEQGPPWDFATAAQQVKQRRLRATTTAAALIDELQGTPAERALRRWALAGPPRGQDDLDYYHEVRLRVQAGQGVSGATTCLTGGVQRARREWERWVDDPEILGWLRHGVTFNTQHMQGRIQPHNSATTKMGTLLPGCGNLPGALEHETFVTMALEELILFGVVRDLGSAHDPNTRVPTVVAPLNVVPKKAGKLRLCHDGRPANKSISPGVFKMETLGRMRYIWEPGGYLITADLNSAYWTLELAPSAADLCGFCWRGRYLQWNALPFGISEACRIFQKFQDALWRGLRTGRHALVPRPRMATAPTAGIVGMTGSHAGIVGLTYIDDCAATASTPEELRWMAAYLITVLIRCGWVISWRKCSLVPTQEGIVLGMRINLKRYRYEITVQMRDKIIAAADEIIDAAHRHIRLPVRTVASFAGKVMSTYLAAGDAAYIYTKDTYKLITNALNMTYKWAPRNRAGVTSRRWVRAAWRAHTLVSAQALVEAQYWRRTIHFIRGAPIAPRTIPARLVATMGADTSDSASGGFLVEHGQPAARNFLQRLENDECNRSSTERELLGLARLLRAFQTKIVAPSIQLYCDSQTAYRALRRGSNKPAIHAAARQVWSAAIEAGKELIPAWLPRETDEIRICDDLSKLVQAQDWQLDVSVFAELVRRYGEPSVDAFADPGNAQVARYYTRFHIRGTAGVDAFTQDWAAEELVYAFPPFSMVGRTVRYAIMMHAKLLIIAPDRPGAPWAPMLTRGSFGVRDVYKIPLREGLIRGYDDKDAHLTEGLMAVLLDATQKRKQRARPAKVTRAQPNKDEQGAPGGDHTRPQLQPQQLPQQREGAAATTDGGEPARSAPKAATDALRGEVSATTEA